MEHAPERIPVLALWSAPRSRSTAFTRMMAERNDHVVVHEPFSQVVDFGEVRVGDRIAHTEQDVLAALRAIAAEMPVFFKDTMDFHYPALIADHAFLKAATHTFIIRHPAEAIASHYALNPNLGRDEIGFAWLYEIFAAVRSATGTTPAVIDSDDLLDRPSDTVRAYCSAVGIPFVPEALSWTSWMCIPRTCRPPLGTRASARPGTAGRSRPTTATSSDGGLPPRRTWRRSRTWTPRSGGCAASWSGAGCWTAR
jgi:hypothetical protein